MGGSDGDLAQKGKRCMEKLNNGVELTWLGHATWLLRSPQGKHILIDPWLEDNPACPDQFKGEGIDEVDVIICSHGHSDHRET